MQPPILAVALQVCCRQGARSDPDEQTRRSRGPCGGRGHFSQPRACCCKGSVSRSGARLWYVPPFTSAAFQQEQCAAGVPPSGERNVQGASVARQYICDWMNRGMVSKGVTPHPRGCFAALQRRALAAPADHATHPRLADLARARTRRYISIRSQGH